MMKNKIYIALLVLFSALGFSACEKVLDIDLPPGVEGIVFEGYIENGTFPYLIITRSTNYFSPIETAIEAIANSIVEADSVFIEVDGVRDTLHQTCLLDLPEEQQALALELLGFENFPPGIDLCIYLNLGITGELGKSYKLTAWVEGERYQATTSIGQQVYLDSLWFKDELPVDSFGSIWCSLTDPAATTDFYYIWTENLTQEKPMAPVDGGPSFGDRLFNGETIEFNFYSGSSLANDNGDGEEYWWFAEGDTVVVKFGTIDRGVYDFWESVDAASNLNPFSSPTPVFSNFDNGGRGVWSGYATTLDTIICVKE